MARFISELSASILNCKLIGDFHYSSGGAGNVITGNYTTADSDVETTADEEIPTSTASGSGSQSTASFDSNISCTSDVATRVSADTSSGGGGSGIDAIIQAGANCAAVDAIGTSSCSRKRALSELECTSSEMCILYGASVLLCLEAESGKFSCASPKKRRPALTKCLVLQ